MNEWKFDDISRCNMTWQQSELDVSTSCIMCTCDFLLVNNADLHPTLHRFPVIAYYWSYRHFWQGGGSSLMYSFSVTSANITVSHILHCTARFSGPYLCHRQSGCSIKQFDVISFEIWCISVQYCPLHHLRLFKVTCFSTNWKLSYDFLLVNNTNLHCILYCFQVIVDYW